MSTMGRRSPITPNYKRMMVFVDVTNFLREFEKELELGVDFRADKPPDEAIAAASCLFAPLCDSKELDLIRSYWFSSYQGSEQYGEGLREIFRKNHFEPVIFKKKPDGREKGVDIALAKEMLVNAFNQNFDVGLLISGDEDYSSLVTEVKRYGPVVWGAFFSHGLSQSLRIEFDMFIDLLKDFNAANDLQYREARTKLCDVFINKVNKEL